jgi:acyl-ACP thioesterase
MNDKVFVTSYKVTHYDADPFGFAKPSALMNYMQDASGLHAKQWGVSVFDLFVEGKTWVISRYHLQIFNRPSIGKEIVIKTWPSFVQKSFALREFEALGPDGQFIAKATISVAMIDLQTKKPVAIGDNLPLEYLTAKRSIEEEFATLPTISSLTKEVQLPVMIRDLDANGHVNHVVYAQWALESVPIETWLSHHLTGIEINYKAEVRHGSDVISQSEELVGTSKDFAHQIINRASKLEVARLRTKWQSKA